MHRSLPLILAACVLAAPAAAHIVIVNPIADAGSSAAVAFRVAHGCGDSATVSLRIQIPAGIMTAKPQPMPGWITRVEHAPLPAPIKRESGLMQQERVVAVTWMGRLDPDQFDEFRILLDLPNAAGTLYFPTLQRCEQGEAAWMNIPARGQSWHDVKQPAPMLEVRKAGPAQATRR